MSTNKWIEHVRKYVKENNIAFSCAISNKKCKECYNIIPKITYKEKKPQKTNLSD